MITRSAASTAASIAAAMPGGLSTRTSSPGSLDSRRTLAAVPGLTSKGNGVPPCAARSAHEEADPCGSASTTRTGTPRRTAAAAKNIAVVVFPTPPLVCTSDQITAFPQTLHNRRQRFVAESRVRPGVRQSVRATRQPTLAHLGIAVPRRFPARLTAKKTICIGPCCRQRDDRGSRNLSRPIGNTTHFHRNRELFSCKSQERQGTRPVAKADLSAVFVTRGADTVVAVGRIQQRRPAPGHRSGARSASLLPETGSQEPLHRSTSESTRYPRCVTTIRYASSRR